MFEFLFQKGNLELHLLTVNYLHFIYCKYNAIEMKNICRVLLQRIKNTFFKSLYFYFLKNQGKAQTVTLSMSSKVK